MYKSPLFLQTILSTGTGSTWVMPIGPPLPPATDCNGKLFHPGGPSKHYPDSVESYFYIIVPLAVRIELEFSSTYIWNGFDIEWGSGSVCDYDWLEIFDGPTSASPSLGKYCNTTGKPVGLSSTGNALTFHFHSDAAVIGQGFEMNWSCRRL